MKSILLVLLLAPAMAFGQAMQNTGTGSVSFGLNLWWTFDSKDAVSTTVLDRSINQLNGAQVNMGGTNYVTGRVGQGMAFDGVNDTVDVTDNRVISGPELSISVWFKTSTNVMRSLFSKIDTSTFHGYMIRLNSDGPSGTYADGHIGFYDGANWTSAPLGAGKISDGNWHHVCVGTSGSSAFVYFDGAFITNKSSTASLSVTNTLQVGRDRFADVYFLGVMDEFRIYNRALAASEIGALYRNPGATSSARSARDRLANNTAGITESPATKPAIILDTDLSSDTDDVGDIAVANYLHNNGSINLLAVIISSKNVWSAPCAKALNTYLGNSNILVGALQGNGPGGGSDISPYTSNIVQLFGTPGDTRTNYTDATTLYRTVLSTNTNVVIIATGFYGPLKNLLSSAADGISSLTGSQLVSSNVSRLVSVAGNYPHPASAEYNFNIDASGANNVFLNWPTPIVCVPITLGDTVFTGPSTTNGASTNPVKYAYQYLTNPRQAWGQLGVLYGAFALTNNFKVVGFNGSNFVDTATGINTWTQYKNVNQSYLGKVASDAALQTTLNAMFPP